MHATMLIYKQANHSFGIYLFQYEVENAKSDRVRATKYVMYFIYVNYTPTLNRLSYGCAYKRNMQENLTLKFVLCFIIYGLALIYYLFAIEV